MKKSELRKIIREEYKKVDESIVRLGKDKYRVKETTFSHVKKLSNKGFEGIIFYGAGGDINDWVNGLNDLWNKEKIGSGKIEDKIEGLYTLKTSGGRRDLLMIFKGKTTLEIGKLAMWRLSAGGCGWLSDYVVNYANQFNEGIEEKIRQTIKEELIKMQESYAYREPFDALERLSKIISSTANNGYDKTVSSQYRSRAAAIDKLLNSLYNELYKIFG